jgi:SAM-dependent MidA family methyltransferase
MNKLTPFILPQSMLPNDNQLAHSAQLLHRTLQVIQDHGGWIDFATYMNLALYEPQLGYYVAGATKLGGAGDFVTAPQLGDLFAKTLARSFLPYLEKIDLNSRAILELGAGTGQLAVDLLLSLEAQTMLPQRYFILEVSPELQERQRQTIATLPKPLAERVEWLSQWPSSLDGIIIANEVLDAFAVHRVELREEGWWQWGVAADAGDLVEKARPLNNPALVKVLPSLNPEFLPYLTEVNLSALALMGNVASSLREGAAYFVDYGFPAREFYHPQRHQGTLMCHYRHLAHTNPLLLLGLQDITSHVDFTALAKRAREEGLVVMEYATQAQFLLKHGILDELTSPTLTVNENTLRQSQQVNLLMSPAEMGELFKVLVLGRGTENSHALMQLGL